MSANTLTAAELAAHLDTSTDTEFAALVKNLPDD